MPGKVRKRRTLICRALSLFTHFVTFWRNVVIYALCRILVKCRDLRIFPGKKIRMAKKLGSQAPKTIMQAWICTPVALVIQSLALKNPMGC